VNPASLPALSARIVEYLKDLFCRGGTVRTSKTAPEFHVDPSATGTSLAELATVGYIPHLPRYGVCLTDTEGDHAEFLVTGHRILSLIIAWSWPYGEPVCQEVPRCGSLAIKGAIDTLRRATGELRQGVCGETTPDDGCMNGIWTGKRGWF
jgi:Mn-dependent DtxR family transcriptional regulator